MRPIAVIYVFEWLYPFRTAYVRLMQARATSLTDASARVDAVPFGPTKK